jgi:hypothetical protein
MKVDQSERVADDKLLQASLLNNLLSTVQDLYNKLREAYEKNNPGEGIGEEEGWGDIRSNVDGEILPDTVRILLK